MIDHYAILPCNGLDKCAGVISGELAIKLSETADNEILCPVFYRVSDKKYNKIAEERPLLVIDGCQTRCASRLATEKHLKITRKIILTEEARKFGIELNNNLRITEKVQTLIQSLLTEPDQAETIVVSESTESIGGFEYTTFLHEKFIFRIPRNPEVWFNENDCWARVRGNRARIGVTDYVQQNLTDILFFYPPEIGAEVDQFGDLGSIESSKAVFELVSPFSGKVLSINEKLKINPEFINENPYESGWIAELELADPGNDKTFLIGSEKYLEFTKKRLGEHHDR